MVVLLEQKPLREQLQQQKIRVSGRSGAWTRALPRHDGLEGPGGLPEGRTGPAAPACPGPSWGMGLSNGSAGMRGGKPSGCAGESSSVFPAKGRLDGGVMVRGEAIPCVYRGKVKGNSSFCFQLLAGS